MSSLLFNVVSSVEVGTFRSFVYLLFFFVFNVLHEDYFSNIVSQSTHLIVTWNFSG